MFGDKSGFIYFVLNRIGIHNVFKCGYFFVSKSQFRCRFRILLSKSNVARWNKNLKLLCIVEFFMLGDLYAAAYIQHMENVGMTPVCVCVCVFPSFCTITQKEIDPGP